VVSTVGSSASAHEIVGASVVVGGSGVVEGAGADVEDETAGVNVVVGGPAVGDSVWFVGIGAGVVAEVAVRRLRHAVAVTANPSSANARRRVNIGQEALSSNEALIPTQCRSHHSGRPCGSYNASEWSAQIAAGDSS
jgi:hypothetical protein